MAIRTGRRAQLAAALCLAALVAPSAGPSLSAPAPKPPRVRLHVPVPGGVSVAVVTVRFHASRRAARPPGLTLRVSSTAALPRGVRVVAGITRVRLARDHRTARARVVLAAVSRGTARRIAAARDEEPDLLDVLLAAVGVVTRGAIRWEMGGSLATIADVTPDGLGSFYSGGVQDPPDECVRVESVLGDLSRTIVVVPERDRASAPAPKEDLRGATGAACSPKLSPELEQWINEGVGKPEGLPVTSPKATVKCGGYVAPAPWVSSDVNPNNPHPTWLDGNIVCDERVDAVTITVPGRLIREIIRVHAGSVNATRCRIVGSGDTVTCDLAQRDREIGAFRIGVDPVPAPGMSGEVRVRQGVVYAGPFALPWNP